MRHQLSRRQLSLQLLAVAGAAGLGCTGKGVESDTGAPDDSGEGDTSESGISDSAETGETGDSGETGETGDTGDTGDTADTADSGWATGGTASMSGDYADPFATDTTPCTLYCATTLGPCYASTLERVDISEGISGLPVRLALRIVEADGCTPVEGARVDIWHTMPRGLYTGADADSSCTFDDAEALVVQAFRGLQVTDADGRVGFDTCFPGWYPGRTLHIHVIVWRGVSEYVTSQLFFDQALIDEIFAVHPEYLGYGAPTTRNDGDAVIAVDALDDYLLAWEKAADGALLTWKTIGIRARLDEAPCVAPTGWPPG